MSSELESDSEVEWEEVDRLELSPTQKPTTSQAALEVQVVLQPQKKQNGAKKNFLEKALAAYARELQHNLHKAHLLCLLANGLQLSRRCDDQLVRALLLSLVPCYLLPSLPAKDALQQLLTWYKVETLALKQALASHTLPGGLSTVQVFVALLRAAGHRARLVLSLRPLPFKLSQSTKVQGDVGGADRDKQSDLEMVPEVPKGKGRKRTRGEADTPSAKKATSSTKKATPKSVSIAENAGTKGFRGRNKIAATPLATPPSTERKRTLRSCKRVDVVVEEGEEEEGPSADEGLGTKGKRRRMGRRQAASPPQVAAGSPSEPHADDNINSTDENSSWAEVFLEDQQRWVCLHVASCTVDCPQVWERHAPHVLTYIIGIENDCVRDVTPRYASNWCTSTRHMRLSEEWWRETLKPYAGGQAEGMVEDSDILNLLYSQPLPMSVADYKGHPLYVLKRHLLKFEAIYPKDCQALGQCRGEEVYERKYVYTLHSRESWLKEAMIVKKGEHAYKIVKARKSNKVPIGGEGSALELFGIWQTEVYTPPPVVDGKVPRNEYGNIELFHPSMLPQGACHMRVPGIQRVARKLGVDYAQAMIGWDFHGGSSHPVFDGIVVAVEHKSLLLEAMEQEEQVSIEKDLKKREQCVLERWKKLCKGLVIRERVKKTYNLVLEA